LASLLPKERMQSTPNQANNFIKTMRGLFRWAVDMEHVTTDPTRDVKLLNVKTWFPRLDR
jgi:site-specific recombinase XerD